MKKTKKKITQSLRFTTTLTWPPKYLQTIHCPLCSATSYHVLYPAYYPRVVACDSCQLIYTNPRLKEQYLEKLYTQDYFQNENSSLFGYQDYLSDREKIKKTFLKRLQAIQEHRSSGKLLDIGCAMGFFMEVANESGWDVEGIEISEFAASFVKKQLGFKVHVGDFQKTKLLKNKYDLITMWDVIEHVPDPVGTMKKAHGLLKKNGLLVLTTPDAGSLPAKVTKHRWVGYKLSDEHLMYFSYDTLVKLCEKSGFQVIRHHQLGKYVSFSMFADRVGLYSKHLGTTLQEINKLMPKDFSFYVSAFDIICLYAIKK